MTENPSILICYNEPTTFYNNYLGKEIQDENENIDLSESEFMNILSFITTTLQTSYKNVHTLGFNKNITGIISKINSINPDIIFNFVESIEGNTKYEICITGMFDILGYSYTGNSSLCLGNCLIKNRTKQLLEFSGIKTPRYSVQKCGSKINEKDLLFRYPVMLKLINEDASIGISENSVVNNFSELKKQLSFLFDNYEQDVLIEEYIEGRELNVSILGGELLPISEISFSGLPDNLPKIVTYEAKWAANSVYYKNSNPIVPADLSKSQIKRIENTALKAYEILGCRDYARVDVRLSTKNIPYVIEVNPNPDISPDSGFIRSAESGGLKYENVLLNLANYAFQRKIDGTKIKKN
jgi:D-alanine-D-alanine ligase